MKKLLSLLALSLAFAGVARADELTDGEVRKVDKAAGKLTLKHGETLCIIGPSGEGKTVTMKHIIGLIRPDKGDVFVDGMHVNKLTERQMAPIRQKVSMLFQGAALFDRMTVEENVAFPLWESGLRDKAEIKKRVTEALEAVDLAEHMDKYPTSLSGGMRKRTGIARAIERTRFPVPDGKDHAATADEAGLVRAADMR